MTRKLFIGYLWEQEGASEAVLTTVDCVLAVGLLVLGLGIGLWFTQAFWIDTVTGEVNALWKRLLAGVVFLLVGQIPGAVQSLSSNSQGGVLSMGGFVAGAGLGFVIGFFRTDRTTANRVFARALSRRLRMGGGQPTPVEVFALGTRYETSVAQKMIGLDENSFAERFAMGAEQMGPGIETLSQGDTAAVLDSLCGVPVSQVARDYGLTPDRVAELLHGVLVSGPARAQPPATR